MDPPLIIGKFLFPYSECPLSAESLSIIPLNFSLKKLSYCCQEALSDFFHQISVLNYCFSQNLLVQSILIILLLVNLPDKLY